jgi:hypothetical protein
MALVTVISYQLSVNCTERLALSELILSVVEVSVISQADAILSYIVQIARKTWGSGDAKTRRCNLNTGVSQFNKAQTHKSLPCLLAPLVVIKADYLTLSISNLGG